MKKLDEFIKTLTSDTKKNIDIILKEMDKNAKNINNVEYSYLLSNLLINECIKEDVNNKEKYVNLANFHKSRYIEFLLQKLSICYGNRDWKSVIYYSNKGLEALSTPKQIDDLAIFEFSNFEDAFFYSHLNPMQKFRWVQSKDAFFLFKKAMAYKMLKDYDLALKYFLDCQDYDPMSFSIYYEIIDIFYQVKNYDKMFGAIQKAYEFSYTNLHIASLLNFECYYFIHKKDYLTAKACLALSLNYDNTVNNANKVGNAVYLIKELSDKEEPFDSIETVKKILKENNAIYKIRQHMVEILCQLYKEFLSDKNANKAKIIEIKEILLRITERDAVDIIENEVLYNKKLIIENDKKIKFNIPVDFSIVTKENYKNLNLISDTFFCAYKDDTILEVSLLRESKKDNNLTKSVEEFISKMSAKEISFNLLEDMLFINGINVKRYKISFKEDNFFILAYFLKLPDNSTCAFQINSNYENLKGNEKLLNNVISSIKIIN